MSLVGYVLLIIFSDLAGHIPPLNAYTIGEWISFSMSMLGILIMAIPVIKKQIKIKITK